MSIIGKMVNRKQGWSSSFKKSDLVKGCRCAWVELGSEAQSRRSSVDGDADT